MARIRRSISWAAHPFVALIAFLFSMIHLAPPAWTMTDGNAEPRHDELTALIGDLCENERFDRCLREELHWLQGDILDLAQAAPDTIQGTITSDLAPSAPYRGVALPETMELAPLNELAPAPDVLLQQQPGGAGQPQLNCETAIAVWQKSGFYTFGFLHN